MPETKKNKAGLNGDLKKAEKELEKLITWLHQGPRMAHVETVNIDWCDPTERYQTFIVTH